MRKYLLLILLAVSASMLQAEETFFDPTRKQSKEKEAYHFVVDYRLEVGYVQAQQRSLTKNVMNPFLHGGVVGATFDFRLPEHFSLQTGLTYSMLYGSLEQHWASSTLETQQEEFLGHKLTEHLIGIPVRAYYTIPLWKELNLFFYGGPKLEIGLAAKDRIRRHLSDGAQQQLTAWGIPTEDYDRYEKELYRSNIQLGVGGGLEWDCYRLEAGYDFGLNNRMREKQLTDRHMSEWSWQVRFAYRINKK